MTTIESEYVTTDFDLKSQLPFDVLHCELSLQCLVLHYTRADNGHYSASYEASQENESDEQGAKRDINSIIGELNSLSAPALEELSSCELREFNMGFECGDSWAFDYSIPQVTVKAVADAGCSLGITLYPMRRPDGTSRH